MDGEPQLSPFGVVVQTTPQKSLGDCAAFVFAFNKQSRSMITTTSPLPIRKAHRCISPRFEFMDLYSDWPANAQSDCCEFAMGNPQTMPMPEFVSAIREAAQPLRTDWIAHKMSEPFRYLPICDNDLLANDYLHTRCIYDQSARLHYGQPTSIKKADK